MSRFSGRPACGSRPFHIRSSICIDGRTQPAAEFTSLRSPRLPTRLSVEWTSQWSPRDDDRAGLRAHSATPCGENGARLTCCGDAPYVSSKAMRRRLATERLSKDSRVLPLGLAQIGADALFAVAIDVGSGAADRMSGSRARSARMSSSSARPSLIAAAIRVAAMMPPMIAPGPGPQPRPRARRALRSCRQS